MAAAAAKGVLQFPSGQPLAPDPAPADPKIVFQKRLSHLGTYPHRMQASAQRPMTTVRRRGWVKYFDPWKRYGYLESGGELIWFHERSRVDQQLTLRKGMHVSFDVITDRTHKPCAVRVRAAVENKKPPPVIEGG